MGFNTNAARASTASSTNAGPKNDSWKASGFLNLYLPGNQGQPKKLGAINLRDANASEKRLCAWLTEDPSRAKVVERQIEVVYQQTSSVASWGFIDANTAAELAAANDSTEGEAKGPEKAAGWLNFYLPGEDGQPKKLGALPLHRSVPSERLLVDWLNKDEANLQVVIDNLTIDFRSAKPTKTTGFSLGEPAKAE